MDLDNKQQFITLLKVAKQQLNQSLQIRDCQYSGFYQVSEDDCLFCEKSMECTWVNKMDDFERFDISALKQQLLIASDFVRAKLTPYHLSRKQCDCGHCLWLKQSQTLLTDTAAATN